MGRIIFVFPGQGVQHVGMGKDVFLNFAVARHVFEEVSDFSKRDIKKICFDGPSDLLNMPDNTSLGVFACSTAVGRVLRAETGNPLHAISYAITGHSMGQYSALNHAESISTKDTVDLLIERSSYMSQSNVKGGMVCVIGLARHQLDDIVRATVDYGYAEISNFNAADQFVISGQDDALDMILELSKQAGAKIARRLNVSIPAHSMLMKQAERKLRNRLSAVDFSVPKTNWFSNHTADFMRHPSDIKEALANQMTHGVKWAQIMEKFPEHNIKYAYEIGPGQMLSKLINRARVECMSWPTGNIVGIKMALNELQKQI